ncbi:1114_t:CDS:10 [Ambispora leptoticha]|uniref:Poly(A) polymerase n=1 Tax=Ambispora leptoticha TaxID=144679 RepID=A0A9N8ZPR3_9GLOM|nr:1114_t:CDS:10 [Ambispora leptoticha]
MTENTNGYGKIWVFSEYFILSLGQTLECFKVTPPRSLSLNPQQDWRIQHLGVTPPIALSQPTPREFEVTDSLLEELKEQGTFESEEESKRREVVLGKLDKIVKDFVKQICRKKNLSEADANEAGGKIFTFGSYRLGADIDTLCVVPRHVVREDFFTEMHEALRCRNEVTELTSVTDAYVPVIKMKFQNIPIDLVFASLGVSKVPDDLDLQDNSLLKNLDETCIRSLNGSRVTDEILRLVPNIPAFRTSLRCIKLWAKRRAIYSNIMGFFGGVAWAMLVARICQLYPNAIAGAIVSRFFRIMYQWNWPQPVLLKPIEEGPLQVRVWNPKLYPIDRSHLMPIITPAYPSMCATHNVTSSTKKIIENEFKRAAEIADKVMVGTGKWNELFAKHDFFMRYRYYLQIIASSDSPERQLKWAGMVESKIRHLITKLELVENLSLAHPFVNGFEKVQYCRNDQEQSDIAYGMFDNNNSAEVNTAAQSQDNVRRIYTTTFYIGLFIEPRSTGATAPRQLDISWPISEFTKMVKSWDKYDEQTMAIVVNNVKRNALPADVFEDGEPRPIRRKSPRATPGSPRATPGKNKFLNTTTTGTEQPNKKRRGSNDTVMSAFDQVNLNNNEPILNGSENLTTLSPATPPTASFDQHVRQTVKSGP